MRLTVLLVAALAALAFTTSASAHVATVTLDCTGATFNYDKFPAGDSPAAYTVTVDGVVAAAGTFTVTGPAAVKRVALMLGGVHTVTARTTWTIEGGGAAEATVKLDCPLPPTCPPGTSKLDDNPLVCLKTETVERVVEKTVERQIERLVWGKPTCPAGYVPQAQGDGWVTCVITDIKVVTKTKVKKVPVIKWRDRVVIKWREKRHPICVCPPGTRLWNGKCHYKAEGSG